MPAPRILAFARTSRCAMVGVGTRKARAISSVVSPPERAQRERDLRLGRERRMAAREDQAEPILRHRRVLLLGRQLDVPRDLLLLLREPRAPAQPVDGLVPRGGDQPARRIRRRAGHRPLLDARPRTPPGAPPRPRRSRPGGGSAWPGSARARPERSPRCASSPDEQATPPGGGARPEPAITGVDRASLVTR